jgi:hypothetical protein
MDERITSKPAIVKSTSTLKEYAAHLKALCGDLNRKTLERCRDIGKLLFEVRRKCQVEKQTPWSDWLAETRIQRSQASRYIRIFVNWDRIEANWSILLQMTLGECLNWLKEEDDEPNGEVEGEEPGAESGDAEEADGRGSRPVSAPPPAPPPPQNTEPAARGGASGQQKPGGAGGQDSNPPPVIRSNWCDRCNRIGTQTANCVACADRKWAQKSGAAGGTSGGKGPGQSSAPPTPEPVQQPEATPGMCPTCHRPLVEVGEIPKALDTPEFRKAWEEWRVHQKQKRVKVTPSSIEKQLRKLSAMGADRAIAAIEHSITGSYQGIFEPNQGGKAGQAQPFSGLREFAEAHKDDQ